MLCPSRVRRPRPTTYRKRIVNGHNRRREDVHRIYMLITGARRLAREPARGHMRLTMRDMPALDLIVAPPQPREYHGVNWDGLRALYIREVRRFWKVGMQTLTAPVVTALLYMMVFVVAVGGMRPQVEGISFGTFI